MASIFDLTSFLTPFVSRIADNIPDPEVRAKVQAEATTEMLNFVSRQNMSQLAVDQAEANNKNLFVAGWRPFIGWVCGATLAWNFIGLPIANWLLFLIHPNAAAISSIPIGDLMPVLMSMLGLGGLRTYEKVKGVAPGGAQ
jgi:hypothetical protein